MANAHELARGHKRLRALIEFAVGEGWHVKRTPGGHLKFTKPGCAAIYTSAMAQGLALEDTASTAEVMSAMAGIAPANGRSKKPVKP